MVSFKRFVSSSIADLASLLSSSDFRQSESACWASDSDFLDASSAASSSAILPSFASNVGLWGVAAGVGAAGTAGAAGAEGEGGLGGLSRGASGIGGGESRPTVARLETCGLGEAGGRSSRLSGVGTARVFSSTPYVSRKSPHRSSSPSVSCARLILRLLTKVPFELCRSSTNQTPWSYQRRACRRDRA